MACKTSETVISGLNELTLHHGAAKQSALERAVFELDVL